MPFAEGNVTFEVLVTRNASGLLFVILLGKFFTYFQKMVVQVFDRNENYIC